MELRPLSIFTATVLQLVVLSIPNADACITLPKAPRPRGLPEGEGARERDKETGRENDMETGGVSINYYYSHPFQM